MKKIVVELMFRGQRKEYQQVELSAARELLAKELMPGWSYVIPDWQFQDSLCSLSAAEVRKEKLAALEEIQSA